MHEVYVKLIFHVFSSEIFELIVFFWFIMELFLQ